MMKKTMKNKWKSAFLLSAVLLTLSMGGCANGGRESVPEQSGMDSAVVASSENDAQAGDSGTADPQASKESEDSKATSEANKSEESNAFSEAKEGEGSKDSTPSQETDASKGSTQPEETFVSDRSEAFALLSNITIGWNLGNTFDAIGAGNTLNSETYWGCPKTTQEMFDALSAQGFNAVRIPVTFAEHVGVAPDYQINEDWLNRIQEVVDYAMNDGMYVMLDTHHEPDYWLLPDAVHEDAAVKELAAIWTQVAEKFKDYDEHLIFEGMNEPRIKGSAGEWSGGTAEERKVINSLNAAFVDAVRKVGGNNEKRLLVICAYGNNPGKEAIQDLTIPADNYIAVAVHMYTPYHFTYKSGDQWEYSNWDGTKKTEIASIAKDLETMLTKNDVPVIVTEFGAVNKDNSEEVVKWIEDYLRIMRVRNMKCFWWDNNCYDTNGENFGIFNRRTLKFFDQNIADALITNANME